MSMESLINELLDSIEKMGKKQKKRLKNICKKISDLEPNYKAEVYKEIYSYLPHAYKKVAQQRNIDMCEKFGHEFSDWKFSLQKEYTLMGDLGYAQKVLIDKKTWVRKCTRCGYEEIVYDEPEIVKEARLESERQNKIKQLKKELNELEKQ